MSERIYALLLRLFPERFRRDHGEEALQLFLDRLRDERGWSKRFRLGCDLVADLGMGLAQSWSQAAHPPMGGARMEPAGQGLPSFRMLERQPMRRGSLLLGALISLAALTTFSFVLQHGRKYSPFDNSGGKDSPIERTIAQANRELSPANATESVGGGGSAAQGRPMAGSPGGEASSLPDADGAGSSTTVRNRQVVGSVLSNLSQHYFDTQRARAAAATIEQNMDRGVYDRLRSGEELAGRLTSDLRSATRDAHVDVVYSATKLPAVALPARTPIPPHHPATPTDCLIMNAETLPHNIGYLKLNAFADPSVCHPAMQAAMTRLNRADALIVDLRDNSGGNPVMVAYVAAWLIPEAEDWYNPRAAGNPPPPQLAPVPESRLSDKPVFVLTSPRTISAAEQFSYNLKELQRVTLVGEPTAGSVHEGTFHRLDDHFGMGIPESRVINPYGGSDWEGKGVSPDVPVPADRALNKAQALAWSAIQVSRRTNANAR